MMVLKALPLDDITAESQGVTGQNKGGSAERLHVRARTESTALDNNTCGHTKDGNAEQLQMQTQTESAMRCANIYICDHKLRAECGMLRCANIGICNHKLRGHC